MSNILINGFGRIGKVLARQILANKSLNLTQINEPNFDINNLCHLLNFDSIHGYLKNKYRVDGNYIFSNKNKVLITNKKNISNLDFKNKKIDFLIDSSGVEKNAIMLKKNKSHNKFTTILTNSSIHSDIEVIYGINEKFLNKSHKIISASICDANALAHILGFIDRKYGIKNGFVTTIHPLLSYQNLLDGPSISFSKPGITWKEYSLGRSTINNLIPKDTTAIKAVEKILPNLSNKLISFSYRVPTTIVSSSDISLNLDQIVHKDDLLNELKTFQKKNKKIVSLNYEQSVSIDFLQSSESIHIDMRWIKSQNNLLKLIIWYDNEWGYCSRVVDIIKKLNQI